MEGKTETAIQALRDGLRVDPNQIDLRLALAQMLHSTDPAGEEAQYRAVTALETSPVGTVRALDDLVEYKFGLADAALADILAGHGDKADAVTYYARAAKVLETYADEGGTGSGMRQTQMGGHTNPGLDASLGQRYLQVMDAWTPLAPPDQQPAFAARRFRYAQKFQEIVDAAAKAS
jgi:hypothetical protein